MRGVLNKEADPAVNATLLVLHSTLPRLLTDACEIWNSGSGGWVGGGGGKGRGEEEGCLGAFSDTFANNKCFR